MANSIKHFIKNAIGNARDFPLETRIFHGVNLITILLLGLIIIVDTLLGLYETLPMLGCIMVIHIFLQYLSRFRRKFGLALIGLIIVGYGGMAVNFFVKEGIYGPSVFVALFISQLLISVTVKRYHLYILLFNFCLIGVLFLIQYHYPGLVKHIYKGEKERFIDYYVSFVFLAAFSYITTRVLLDNYNIERQKAQEQANYIAEKHADLKTLAQDKDRLFSLVFHDLKSPLASIQFYLEEFNKLDLEKDEHDDIKKELLTLSRSASAMLENMLLWIREQINEAITTIKEVPLFEVVENALSLEMYNANRKNIQIQYKNDEGIVVKADPIMTQLVLRTFINNAIKFSYPGSAIVINVKFFDKTCKVEIIDKGIGIPDEIKTQIFTTGIHSTYGTSHEKGFGIGLALAKKIADRQGLTIGFESESGGGSTFFLLMPSVNSAE